VKRVGPLHLFCLTLLAAVVPAQKAETKLDWLKRWVEIHYEALPVGDHSLSKLKVGAMWRLGASHDASTLLAMSPILLGDTWLAPGRYRIRLLRAKEDACALVVEGADQALGSSATIQFAGQLTKLEKPAKKLAIELIKKGAATPSAQPAQLGIRFGSDEWRGEMQVLGHETLTVGDGKLSIFTVPKALLEQGPVPIGTLAFGKNGAEAWNLILDGQKVRLVPWMEAPKTIDDAVPAAPIAASEGELQKLEEAIAAELAVLDLRSAQLQKGELKIALAFGMQAFECRLRDPRAKAAK
jgi:hypothetical protein